MRDNFAPFSIKKIGCEMDSGENVCLIRSIVNKDESLFFFYEDISERIIRGMLRGRGTEYFKVVCLDLGKDRYAMSIKIGVCMVSEECSLMLG